MTREDSRQVAKTPSSHLNFKESELESLVLLGAFAPWRESVLSNVTFYGYAGISANTRSGLPEPLTIFNGGAITTAPVGGS